MTFILKIANFGLCSLRCIGVSQIHPFFFSFFFQTNVTQLSCPVWKVTLLLVVLTLDCTAIAMSGKVRSYIWCMIKHTSWVAIITPTDRPKSVRNHCVLLVIERFGGVFALYLCPYDFSVGAKAFVIGLSQISSFSQSHNENKHLHQH